MQVKVLGVERRRRWSCDEKVRLIEETLHAGEIVSGIARRHRLAAKPPFHLASAGAPEPSGQRGPQTLVPVEITSAPAPKSTGAPQPLSPPPAQRTRAEMIELELGIRSPRH